MTRDEIIAMAREAGAYPTALLKGALMLMSEAQLEDFYALATAKEREARQEAQRENEALKAKLAASGVELRRRAVLAEREAWITALRPAITERMGAEQVREAIQQAIRARCPLYDPRDVSPSKITPAARARMQEASQQPTDNTTT